MSKIEWSENQKSAIFAKYRKNGQSQNILVSAAAGSGKTAVLVQRIIEKLVPKDLSKATPANNLLVVTFTKAAAGEMSERIEKSLKESLKNAVKSSDIERQNLIKKQQLLICDSEITTIDAFCIKLVRRYFNVLNIAPDFQISDEAQEALLFDESMNELFDELYEENNPEFLNLLCLYATNRSDDKLKTLIKYIYDFIIKLPNPLNMLYDYTKALNCETKDTLWYKNSTKKAMSNINYAFNVAKDALSYLGCDDLESFILKNPPEKNVPIFDEWKSYYKLFYTYYTNLSKITDYESAKLIMSAFAVPRFSKLTTKTEEEKAFLVNCNEKIKSALAFSRQIIGIDTEALTKMTKEHLCPVAESLYNITKRFYDKFYEKKLSKNLFSFADIEQLSHKLLSENADISSEIQTKYEEVLMDEYQDTSLLQEAIFSFVTNGTNLFTVGDMKQSIYRFRSSDPTIFKARLDSYGFDADELNRKIILSQNFRSRAEVLNGINDIFEAVMSEEAGELIYDENQRLYLGNKGYEKSGFDYRPEAIIINKEEVITDDEDEEKEELSNAVLEARFVASEISRLKSGHFMVQTKDGLREIQNRDIVILMSSHKSSADIYTAELNSVGIDCFVEVNGYFERNEIRLMTALFKVINNPYNDVPLLSVLRSPIAGFTDNELVLIRKCQNRSFYSALKEYINLKNNNLLTNEEEINTAKKAENFCNNLSRWRSYCRYMPTDKLVWTLYEETDFYAFSGAMYGGDEAQANLRLLFERAKQYESSGFSGLFGFIKYISRLEKKGQDLSCAKMIGENHNVVRIMTIHKSKGLEFPVVFVTGGEKKFQKKLDQKNFIMHKDYGLCLSYINFEKNYTVPSPAREFFRQTILAEQLSEDIRKLYVAMTRAKEKLYFVSAVKNTDILSKVKLYDGKLNSFDVLSANSFAEFVLPVATNSKNWIPKILPKNVFSKTEERSLEDAPCDNASELDIDSILSYKYPYSESTLLPTKVSVSNLKGADTNIIPKPAFLDKKSTTGANYGTIIHNVLQHFNYTANITLDYVKSEIERLYNAEILQKSDLSLINPHKIFDFYNSSIGRRMLLSTNIHREQAFEVEIPAKTVYPEFVFNENETIILQGIIDCWFEEDDGIVLLDYKTDYYTDFGEIHKKYDLQLQLYAYALSKITKKTFKNKFFYLFFDGNVLECN